MPFASQTYSILIASPSDLSEEREAARQAIHEWNDLNAEAEGVTLLPVTWETHSTPEYGDRPQEILNKQIVRKCDLLIGLFWTKLGSETGVAESGTVEEIDEIVRAGKPAMLYFSQRPVAPSKIDTKQMDRLKQFQGKVYREALCGTFATVEELRRVLVRDLTKRVRMMRDKDTVISEEEELARKAAEEQEQAKRADAVRSEFDQRVIRKDFHGVRGERGVLTLCVVPVVQPSKPIIFSQGLLLKAGGSMRPIGENHGDYLSSARSLVVRSETREGESVRAATELTDRGTVYAARHWLWLDPDDKDKEKVVQFVMSEYEPQIVKSIFRYLSMLRDIGIPGPWHAGFSLMKARKFRLVPCYDSMDAQFRRVFEGEHATTDTVLFTPDLLPEGPEVGFSAEQEQDFMKVLKHPLDQFWRDFGNLYGATSYDPDTGRYKGLPRR